MSHGLYAGTFDPLTNGHAYVIRTAAAAFDEVTVVVAANPEKKTMFTVEERVAMIYDATLDFPNVQVEAIEHEYTVNAAARLGADFLIRGVRNATDLDYERTLCHVNGKIRPEIKSVIFMPPPDVEDISSSLVKGLVGPPGWRKAVKRMVPKAVYDALIKKHFVTFVARAVPSLTVTHIHDLLEKYSQPHRGYHNCEHIMNCLEKLAEFGDIAKDPALIARALCYHDYFYDPHAPGDRNERESAAEFSTQSTRLSTAVRQKGYDMIRATAWHFDLNFTTHDADTELMLDIDLASLASDEDEQGDISAGIRKEYSFVPEDVYNAGRAALMRKLLTKPFIYRTSAFRDLYEAAARKNILREAERLEKRVVTSA